MKKLLLFTILITNALLCFSQDTLVYSNVQNVDMIMANVFGIQCAGVSNLQMQANPISVGKFEQGNSIGLNTGIVMSTGAIYNAGLPSAQFSSLNLGMPGDMDVDQFGFMQGINYPSLDATIIEFDFTPSITDTIRFNYVFASEEYPEYVNQNYTDRFLFLVSKNGGPYENIARLPNTNTTVEINTVNQFLNSQYFIDNLSGPNAGHFSFDGYTVPLEAKFFAQIDSSYHIKLVISDISDALYDSAIFLEEQSAFNNISGNLQVDGQPAEGIVEVFNYVQSNVGIATPVYSSDVSNGILDADSLSTGLYHVRFTPDPVMFPNASPTYFINGDTWQDADAIGLPCFYDPANISSDILNTPMGNGGISGIVSIDTSYTKTSLESMEGALVKLFNSSNELIGFTYSNQDGAYSFDNLSIGTYHMKLDVPYIPQADSHSIEITTDEVFIGADFEISNDLINPINNLSVILGVDDTGKLESAGVYPNPATDVVYIKSAGNSIFEIYNTNGKVIRTGQTHQGTTKLNLDGVDSGIYYIKMNNFYEKLIIK